MNKVIRRPEIWIGILAISISIFAGQFRLRFPFDDTFITFRYADHLFDGHGFVWNIGGPHTEGFTNFLFVVVLACFRLFTTDLLLAAQLVGLVSTAIAGLLLYRTATIWRNTRAGILAAVLFLLTPLTWINALSGMETSFFVLLTALAIYFFAKDGISLGFGAALLATLTRPEAGLIAALTFLFLLFQGNRRKTIVSFAGSFALPLLAYIVWKYFYFGELLPNSFYIKVSEVRSSFPGLQYVRLFITSAIVLVFFSCFNRYSMNVAIRTAVSWAVLLILFFVFVLPLEGLYDRFLWPAFAALCLLAATGLHDLTGRIARLRFELAAAVVIGLHLSVSFLTPRTTQAFAAHEDIWDRNMENVIEEIRHLPHYDSLLVGYGDAGYVVYKSGIRHLDLFGLNDTKLAHARSKAERAEVVVSERPDLLLLPIRMKDSCAEFIEDAYGVGRSDDFVPLAMMDAFPYSLTFAFNKKSRWFADCEKSVQARLTDSSTRLHGVPSFCY